MIGAYIDNILASFSTILTLFLLGFVIRKCNLLSLQTADQLAKLIVGVLLPLYLFHATATTSSDLTSKALVPVLAGVATTLIAYPVAVLTGRLVSVEGTRNRTYVFSNMFLNSSFLGIPISTAFFGSQGTIYAALFDFGTGFVVLTLGVWCISGRSDIAPWRSALRNPLMWGVVLGALSAAASIRYPQWVTLPLETLGAATLPFAIMMCGVQIAGVSISQNVPWRQLSGLMVTRLLLAPVMTFAVLTFFDIDAASKAIVTVLSGMPVGLSTVIFAKMYAADADFAAIAIITSTFLAVVTIPAVVYVLSVT